MMRFLILFFALSLSLAFGNSLIQKQIDGMKRFSGAQQQSKKEQEIKPPKQEMPKTATTINPIIHTPPLTVSKPQNPLYISLVI